MRGLKIGKDLKYKKELTKSILSIKCWLFGHDWKMVRPIAVALFINEEMGVETPKTLNRCNECGKLELRDTYGSFIRSNLEVMAEEEYINRFHRGIK